MADSKWSPGLCDRIYAGLQARLADKGVRVEIDRGFTPIKRILLMVEEEPGFVFCGTERNAEREKRFVYAKTPLYRLSNVVAVHKNDPWNPRTMAELGTGKPIAALYGSASARFLQSTPGVSVYARYHSPLEALKAVAQSDRGMAFFYYDLGVAYMIRERSLPVRMVPHRLRTVDQWMIYNRQTSPVLQAMIEETLEAMSASGELDEIQRLYTDP
ncbi:substrate-binding periplasmic protein [Aestuariirhabdus litorea]|nr:transporter substrate-binding domain-containing protein [Aestuariirhabdus litorea]RWW93455.1 transporter substrate-binding domain-containing protein [Endozoicomonadaceae bacterium GTF-13]